MRMAVALALSLFPATTLAQQNGAPSVQSRFDAAKAQLDAKQYAEAEQAYSKLESDLLAAAKPSPANIALTRLFKGTAQLKQGKLEEALAATNAALADKALDKPSLAALWIEAQEQRGQLQSVLMDDVAAAQTYALLASRPPSPAWAIGYASREAQLRSIFDPARAVVLADEVLAKLSTDANSKKADLAIVHSTRGRALLNLGKISEARAAFDTAIGLRGGLDTRVDSAEYAMRSDAAIAALRDSKPEQARKLMAYSGLGGTDKPFPTAMSGLPPQCGGLDGLAPQDSAVVEFALGTDGRVIAAKPVFSSKAGMAGYVFAQAVKDWEWQPAALEGYPHFFLQRLRVEVRCTNSVASASGQTGSNDIENWITAKLGALPPADRTLARDASRTKAQAETEPARAMAAWLAHAMRTDVERDETRTALEQAANAARKAGAPLDIVASIQAARLGIQPVRYGRKESARRSAQAIHPLLQQPEFANDALASAKLRLLVALYLREAHQFVEEEAMLKPLAEDGRLPENHPSRIAALVALANAAAATGRIAEANDAFARTGLSPSQCSALSQPPALLRDNANPNDFPMEAMRWGFTGWVKTEYDIGANGKPANARAVVSFPPAVFTEAGTKIAEGLTYRKSFRPDGSAGCTAFTSNVRFNIPGR